MRKESEVLDEFPQLVADAIIALMKLPVPDEDLDKVISTAVANEVMYRFSDAEVNEINDKRIINLIHLWCDQISKLTGYPLHIESLSIGRNYE